MKREDIKNILGEGATEEQITNLLNAFHNSNKEEKNTITELQSKIANMSDYDSIKNQLDEINKAKMTEQEKLEADKQLTAQKLKEANIIYNTAKVKSILAGNVVNLAQFVANWSKLLHFNFPLANVSMVTRLPQP